MMDHHVLLLEKNGEHSHPFQQVGDCLKKPFFKPLKNTVSDFKLRASVGTAGYDGTAAYQWLSGFNYNHFWIHSVMPPVPTIDNTALANAELTWETNTTYDVGLDAALYLIKHSQYHLTISLEKEKMSSREPTPASQDT